MNSTRKRRTTLPIKIVLIILILVFSIFIFTDSFKVLIDYFDGRCLTYLRLTPNEEIVTKKDIKDAFKNKTESKLFALGTDDDFQRIIDGVNKGDNNIDKLTKKCNKMLNNLDLEFFDVGEGATNFDEALYMSFLWRITKEEKYAKGAKDLLDAACKLNDWKPTRFLWTAPAAYVVATTTNWLYDYLTDEEVRYYANRCNELAFKEFKSLDFNKTWWKLDKYNWGTQCFSAIGIAALVFYEYYPDNCAYILKQAYNRIPYAFDTFKEDGVYLEGAGYFAITIEGCLANFLATSNNVINTDFGISENNYLKKVVEFQIYNYGATGTFNYADSFIKETKCAGLYWYARKFNNPALTYYANNSTLSYTRAGDIISLLWRDDSILDGYTFEKENCKLLKSNDYCDVAYIRSAYFDKSATFLGVKGGYNYVNHGDLDIGSFVYDYNGVRWVEDLGHGDYFSDEIDVFDNSLGGDRWKYYSKSAEGHNTLLINSKEGQEGQYLFAKVPISSCEEKDGGGIISIDMTDAYFGFDVYKVERSFMVYDNYSKLKIIDNIECNRFSNITWSIHTRTDIELIDSHHAILISGDKKMLVELSHDSIGEFYIEEDVCQIVEMAKEGWVLGAYTNKLMVKSSNNFGGKIEVTFSYY